VDHSTPILTWHESEVSDEICMSVIYCLFTWKYGIVDARTSEKKREGARSYLGVIIYTRTIRE
jgi:hypothetical protein